MADLDRRLTQIQTSGVKHSRAEHEGDGSVVPTPLDVTLIPRTSPNHLRKYKASGIQHQRFPVKISNPTTEVLSVSAAPAKKPKSTDKCSPWETYHKFMMLDQAGPAIIAHSKFSLVAIKERPAGDRDQIDDIISITSSYLVNLERIFLDESTIYLVYECMDVALRNICSCPKGDLEACEIAAVCKEVDRHRSSVDSLLTLVL